MTAKLLNNSLLFIIFVVHNLKHQN